MHFIILSTILCSILSQNNLCSAVDFNELKDKWPTIGVSILVRNKAHTLPYFFSCFSNLDYPKDRIYVWIYSDHNVDNSIEIIEKWADKYNNEYNGIFINTNTTSGSLHSDEASPLIWSDQRFQHLIGLRESAMHFARRMWADMMFMLDADIFLTEPLTLKHLLQKNLPVVAPMLLSDGLYSNFWCAMTENYFYKSTDDYKSMQKRDKLGCFQVPMVHSAVLISLREKKSDLITYDPDKIHDYNGPYDDIIAFAINALNEDIPLTVCNDHLYGFLPVPLEEDANLEDDYEQILNVKLEALSKAQSIPLNNEMKDYVVYPEMWKFGLDEIFLINLDRRKERRYLMERSFKELGMDVKRFKAIDGRNLDMNNLNKHSINLMPNYEDPYQKRPMKAGEIGCFLSHYYIWNEIVNRKLEKTLVLEDDIHFTPHFRKKFLILLDEIGQQPWDLVYLGRKILLNDQEEFVTPHTTRPLYSYWTLGYLLSFDGAMKLLRAKPLDNLLAVDEFLPIMFDQHPNGTWKSHFPNRDLVALSAAPLLLHPTHYTGQKGYISDTEDSIVIADNTDPLIRNEL